VSRDFTSRIIGINDMIGGKFAAGGNNIHGHTFFLDSTKAPTVSLPTVP
jgi:hypothetical protein